MIEDKIKNLIQTALQKLDLEIKEVALEHPADLALGDFSTNIALVLGKREFAEKIAEEIKKNLPNEVERVEVAGPGFINFYLNKYFFQDSIKQILENEKFGRNDLNNDKKIMVEYTDANPFKPFHVGHLMDNAIGESIAKLLEYSGAKVSRAIYQGDVGLHIAMAIYGLMEKPEAYRLKKVSLQEQSIFIGKAYGYGREAYETDPETKRKIDEINKKVYQRSDKEINDLYDWGFKVTMEAYEEIYKTLGTKFDYYFLESKVAPLGQRLVEENLGKIFEKSDGAVIFPAEKYDPALHTRVFLTREGLPTYEAKELGLTETKFEEVKDLHLSIVTTGNEQKDYMKVVKKALSLIRPEHADKMLHITHGLMRFSDRKMSSRTGDVITGNELMEKVKEKTKGEEKVAVAAIKYAILKQAIGGDIIFDMEKSVSPEGDSGPYLQYSYARARSVIEKGKAENISANFGELPTEVSEMEKTMYRFPEVVARAAEELEPHYVANFLIDLARAFNSFYGSNKIVDKGDIYSPYKIALTAAFARVLEKGLWLLGIVAPEKM